MLWGSTSALVGITLLIREWSVVKGKCEFDSAWIKDLIIWASGNSECGLFLGDGAIQKSRESFKSKWSNSSSVLGL